MRRPRTFAVSMLLLQRANPFLVNVERRHAQALLDEGVDKGFSNSARGPRHDGHFSRNSWISHWVSPSLRFLALVRAAALSLAALRCEPNS